MEDTAKYEVECPQCRDKDKRIQELEEALTESLKYFDHNKNIMNPQEGWKRYVELSAMVERTP